MTSIAILKEVRDGERRVGLTPAAVRRMAKLGIAVAVEAGAGDAAGFDDAAFAGAAVVARPQLIGTADVVVAVQPPPADAIAAMKPGAVLVSFLYPAQNPDLVRSLRDGRISALAMDLVPRISRAQAMDALTSQAALAGYYAPLLGAVHLPRILPMMTTAVGSLRAAKVLVMGLGVAGLQALATAHRLGAVTQGYDVRPETAEQARSLGAKFLDTGVDARGDGGYARELTPDEQASIAAALTRHIAEADLIVTAASVPERRAPRLVTAAQVAGMKHGAVIVDLGAESGGNVEGARPGETVTIGPATVLAPLNVPSLLAEHASELYARNVASLLELVVREGAIQLDLQDEIVAGTLLTHDGRILNDAVRATVEGTPR